MSLLLLFRPSSGDVVVVPVPPSPLWRIGGYPSPPCCSPSTGERMLRNR